MSNIQATKTTANNHNAGLHSLDINCEHFDKMFSGLKNQSPFELVDSKLFESKYTVLTPNVDIKETKESYAISAELPGLDSTDISIEISDNVLTISGEKKTESSKQDEQDYHVMERHYGFFKR